MNWIVSRWRRFRAVGAALRQLREFNRTHKGTLLATSRKSLNRIYDQGGEPALKDLIVNVEYFQRREREVLGIMKS